MSRKAEKTQDNCLNLPRNIQQIGMINEGVKIYLEDYSGTYVRRILSGEKEKHAIFLGRKQTDKKQTYLFIEAVIEVEPEYKENKWKYDWNYIYEIMQKYFIEEGRDKPEILGWAMSIEDYRKLDMHELENAHRSNFEANMSIAMLLDNQEGREQFYVWENNRFHSLNGYYIFYEKNKTMQTYVLENQSGPCVETEALYKGSRESYRTILMQRKEAMQKRHTMSLLYVASTFLVMLVVVLGITMMNNYEKMQHMQNVLSDLSKSLLNGEPDLESDSGKQDISAENEIQASEVPPVIAMIENGTSTVPAFSSPAPGLAAASESVTEPGIEGTQQPATEEHTEPQVVEAMSQTLGTKENSSDESNKKNKSERKQHRIEPGDTLLAISLKYYNTSEMVEKICEYNGISDDNQIMAGDVLLLP